MSGDLSLSPSLSLSSHRGIPKMVHVTLPRVIIILLSIIKISFIVPGRCIDQASILGGGGKKEKSRGVCVLVYLLLPRPSSHFSHPLCIPLTLYSKVNHTLEFAVEEKVIHWPSNIRGNNHQVSMFSYKCWRWASRPIVVQLTNSHLHS